MADDLSNALQSLNAKLAAATQDAAMAAAKVIEFEIRARAPVLTGALVASLDNKSQRRVASASATVQVERSGPDGTEHYAIFQEFGTSKMPAHPFMRPGFAAAQSSALAAAENVLKNSLKDFT